MDGIFISYRRDDSAGYAGRLYDRLAAHFSAGRVFMDVEGIELGTDFVTAIENAVGSCQVLIVVIGDEWLNTTDAAGRRRLDDPNDFIRLETVTALQRGIRVVPVLVGGALMPRAEELPEDLRPLARRQAIEVSHKQWEASTAELIRALESILSGGAAPAAAPLPPREPVVAASGATGRRRWPWALAMVGALFAVTAGWWSMPDSRPQEDAEVSSRPVLSAAAPAQEDRPATGTSAATATPPPVVVAAAPPPDTPPPVSRSAVATRPTAVAPAAVALPRATTGRAPTAAIPAVPSPPTVTALPRPVAPPEPVRAQDTGLPRLGETWTYRTSGKWPTSPKRTVTIGVQAVGNGSVTDSLRADPPAGASGEVRSLAGAAAGFVTWSGLGNEFSPYLAAFTNLANLGTQRGFATPSVDGQWGQWYSEARVLGQESVTVPAGRFDAYKVEVSSNRQPNGGAGSMQVEPVRIHYLIWYAPEAKRYVKMQRRIIVASGDENEKDVFELVSHR